MAEDWLAEAEKPSKGGPQAAEESSLKSALKAGAEGVVSSIPGGEYLINKIGHALHPEISADQLQAGGEAIQSRSPTAYAAGNLAGDVAQGAVLPVGPAGKGVASVVGRLATQGAIGAALTPAYKFGETANQAQLQNKPITTEQIRQVFSLDDILKSAGLSVLTAGVLHGAAGAAEGAGVLASKGAKKYAESEAERIFTKAPGKTGKSPEALAQTALNEGLLEPGAIDSKLKEISGIYDDLKSTVNKDAGGLIAKNMATQLANHAQQYEQFAALAPERNFVLKNAKALASAKYEWDGAKLQDLINQLSDKRRATKEATAKAFLGDALNLVQDEYASGLDAVNPGAAAKYRATNNDYRLYTNMAKDIKTARGKQATATDLAKAGAYMAGSAALGNVAAGPTGAAVAELAGMSAARRAVRGTNKALLADKFSKAVAPGQLFEERAQKTVNFLMKGGTDWIAQLPAKDLHKRYDEVSTALQQTAADSATAAQNLRQQLNFLPSQQADAATAQIIDQLQTQAIETQSQNGVNTAFGLRTVKTDREKRETLRKLEAAHDPHYAVASGSPAAIAEAKKYHPETIRELQTRVMTELSTRKNVPYSTKRRISAILGVAGTATQDPLLGGLLQTTIVNKRQQESAQGQADSARNKAAGLKKDMESATRVQNLMRMGTGDK